MRHQKKNLKLNNRDCSHRKLLVRNLVTSLILFEKIKTTPAKARLAKSELERLIATVKRKDKINAIRLLNSFLLHKNACLKTMDILIKRYENRTSGFVRVVKLGMRVGDAAPIVQMELVK